MIFPKSPRNCVIVYLVMCQGLYDLQIKTSNLDYLEEEEQVTSETGLRDVTVREIMSCPPSEDNFDHFPPPIHVCVRVCVVEVWWWWENAHVVFLMSLFI